MRQHRLSGFLWLVLLGLFALTAQPAAAQSPLTCDPPYYAGVTHCTTDSGQTHIILIDLGNPHIRFETVMANEEDTVNPPVAQRELVADMAARYQSKGAVAAINADYFSMNTPQDTHGPEGFTVKNGHRIDGPHSNDTDSAASSRSSLAVSRSNRVEIGEKSETDLQNKSSYQDRFYNAVGGGPLIVREGTPLSNAEACGGRNNGTVDKFPPGVCTSRVQTAAGVTRDGRTLILVMSGRRDAAQVAQLLVEHGAYTAMKFDGGGSSQMWYNGVAYYGSSEKRPVANALVVFSSPLPEYDAVVANQSNFIILDPGQLSTLYIEMKNTGRQTWTIGQGIKLVRVGGEAMSAQSPLALPGNVSPGQTGRWEFAITAPGRAGLYQTTWQLERGKDTIGPAVTVNVIVLPPEAKELREKLERKIQEWRRQGEQKVEELIAQITEEITKYLEREVEKGLRSLCSTSAVMLGLACVLWWGKRR